MCFENVFIVGFGQMGKSIAGTLHANNFGGKIMVFNRSGLVNCNFVDRVVEPNALLNYNNSVIFVCTPPNTVPEIVSEMLTKTKAFWNCVISDICSIKKNVAKISGKNFISTHPMDGGRSDKMHSFFFKKKILNYIITDNFMNVDINVLTRYNNFLQDFLNCKNINIDAKTHDKVVAFTSHLQNLILASYYGNLSKLDGEMWREIFIQNKENIEYFLDIFLERVNHKISKGSLVDAVVLAVRDIMRTEKIEIDEDYFNPSLKAVLSLQEKNINVIENKIDYLTFTKNMQDFFINLAS